MRRSGLFWGAILVSGGVLLLLDNLGILRVNVWSLIWPLALIAWGVWTLIGAMGRRGRVAEETASIPLEGATSARVRVHYGAGRLRIHAGAEAGQLAAGTFAGGLDYQTQRMGDVLELSLRSPSVFSAPWGGWGPGQPREWSVGLSREIPLTLEVEAGASETHLDLADLRVTDLRLETGASASDITLPERAGHTRAHIEAGAASVEVRIPEGVGARIRLETGLSSTHVDPARFPRQGEVYQSVDYESAANRVDLEVEAGAGAVTIR